MMRLFQFRNDHLVEIHEDSFGLERTIQNLVEKDLGLVFPGLLFMDTEFQIDDLRPDTIAFDSEKKSFVIIEYKRVGNSSLIDQGVSYYQLLQDRKENFVLLYNKKMDKTADVSDINWDEARVIFISPEYTKYQKRASGFRGLPIELYEIKKYHENMISLERISDSKTKGIVSRKPDKPRGTQPKGTVLRKPDKPRGTPSEYTEEDYLAGRYSKIRPTDEVKKLWNQLKDAIEDTIADVEFKQRKVYAGYYLLDGGSSVCTFAALKSKLDVYYFTSDKSSVETSEFVQDMSNVGHNGIGDFRSSIKSPDDIARVMPLIRKAYQSRKSKDFKTKGTVLRKPDKPRDTTPKGTVLRKPDKPRDTPTKYTDEDYLAGRYYKIHPTDEVKKLWNQLKDAIEGTIADVEFKQRKSYGGYYLRDGGSLICTFLARKRRLDVFYSTSDKSLIETSEFVKDMSNVGHDGVGDFRSSIKSPDDIARVMPLIRKAYQSRKSKRLGNQNQ